MLSPIQKDCTRVLDPAIAEQRKQYAAVREDFHGFFPEQTVRGIQRILREKRSRDDEPDARRTTVRQLLHAQKESPHELWRLLLLQAFEKHLVRRRRALSEVESAALDHLVVRTFLAALEAIPYALDDEDDIRSYVLARSRKTLEKAVGRKPKRATEVPPPPASGVSLTETGARRSPGRRRLRAVSEEGKGS